MRSTSGAVFSEIPLRRVSEAAGDRLDRSTWPGTLAPVRDLLEGFEFGAVTVFLGENGAGKSTLVEGIAAAWGFPPDGGSRNEQRAAVEGVPALADHLRLERGVMAPGPGFFLRAETMHGFAEWLHGEALSARGKRLLRESHGESFLDLMVQASRRPGLWIMDEPESALSFQGQLALIGLVRDRVAEGSQVIVSTHSPILAAAPGADLCEVGDGGLRRAEGWADLEVVGHWQSFMAAPERYLRHLVD